MRIFLFLLFSFFLTESAFSQSCHDGVKNGHEVDIDCGGICSACDEGLVEGKMIYDESSFQYKTSIWLPPGYDENNEFRKFPLIVFLHGIGEENLPLSLIIEHGPMNYRNQKWYTYPFIIANPVSSSSWSTIEVNSFIDELMNMFHIDRDKLYMTGLSSGAYSVSDFCIDFPEKLSAVFPIAGQDPPFEDCHEFKGTPIWYFHDIGDRGVPFKLNKVDGIKNLHMDCGDPSPDPYVFLSVFNSERHESWYKIYNPWYRNWNPYNYAKTYELADISFLDDKIDFNSFQRKFGLPNGVEPIYDWLLKYENIPNHCRNEKMDADETGVDCGGSCNDCSLPFTCRNGALDTGEIAIDCGGVCPACERDIIYYNGAWNNQSGPLETDNAIIHDNYTGQFVAKSLQISKGHKLTISGIVEVKEFLSNKGTIIVPSGSKLISPKNPSTSGEIIYQKNN